MAKCPKPISDSVSGAMRSMPEHSTGPEMAVRRMLHKRGLRYRVQYPVPGAPRRTIDIAFPGRSIAVFIDGCFWHGCAEHRNIPAHNRDWWQMKIGENRARDLDTDERLKVAGWSVFRFWEHDAVEMIVELVMKANEMSKTTRSEHGST